ncbi:hypothetical protein D3C75_639560 [compost metagenome]
MHHLDGVDDHDLRLLLLGNDADLLHAGFRQHAQLVGGQAQPAGPHRHLLQRLLPGHIQGLHPLCQTTHGLQQQGRFASPRVATNEDRRARHHTTAEHPVQLLEARTEAGDLGGRDLSQGLLPPMRIAEPGTTPPPSTRSSSLKPELKRGISVVATSARVCTWLPTAPA